MEELLTTLRDLGVYVPENLDAAGLLRHARKLNPWTVSTGQDDHDLGWYAFTKASEKVWAASEAQAVLELLLIQLKAQRYTVYDTTYKLSAQQR